MIEPRTATVEVAAGNVSVKLLAPALALVKVVMPLDEPFSNRSLFVKVCAAVKVCAVPKTATVSVAAGNVITKVEAIAGAFRVMEPEVEPFRSISPSVKVCAAVHVLALPRLSEATTAPVFGEMVSAALPAVTELTAAAPEHDPQVGGALDPDSMHCPAVTVGASSASPDALE